MRTNYSYYCYYAAVYLKDNIRDGNQEEELLFLIDTHFSVGLQNGNKKKTQLKILRNIAVTYCKN